MFTLPYNPVAVVPWIVGGLLSGQGLSLTGPDGLVKQLTKTVPETGPGDDRAPRP
jgi:hypothetical protein